MEICLAASLSGERCGKRKRSTGLIVLERRSISPAPRPISSIPVHSDITPSIVMHKDTASFAEASAP